MLEQAERLRTEDHPRFVQMLDQARRQAPAMSRAEQWRLRYLEAWEIMYRGEYTKSESQLREIIDHSGDTVLVAKASALLLSNLGINRRYEEAFELANRVTGELSHLTDTQGRFVLLINLSQMLALAGQVDLAVQYAQRAEETLPAGESPCRPVYMRLAALYDGKRLASSDAQLMRGIEICSQAHQPIVTNALRLIQVSLLLNENQPRQALDELDQIAPSIRAGQYQPQILSAHVQRAEAYEKLGNDHEAGKAALAAVAMSGRDDINEWLKAAYEILYRIEKKRGNAAAALAYYEKYTAQDKGYLDDVSARALAYQVVQQHVLAKKLETEALSKQNSILRLQQALATKAMETSRLYIALLLLVIASIVLWLFRLKRSQLRFKKLSSLDGLTGTVHHQHFMGEADRALRLLEKRRAHACLVLIDLDHFKQVNDTHGHAAGDAVLRRTVAICRLQLRPVDLFGRLGGEEFGILLPECSREQGMETANHIRVAIESTPMNGGTVSVSASVGVAATDTCGYVLQRLCMEADAALYRAKRGGRNRVIADIEAVETMPSAVSDGSRLSAPASRGMHLGTASETAES
ncbi:MAG TPA: GGDEF domain-containing protein [Frateuria sp.]|uniref:tetratricopeptide repeat-containing diguanylate cyclase n=1 Tax=Frateuria sp. TaxID=2211372 RepID=UPI002DE9CE06|nr:GGDEF domain-containing protein [Frateuria sp.]